MSSFSSLVGVSVTDYKAVAPVLGMIPPPLGVPRTYKPCTLLKPSKGSNDTRWLLIWWQYSPTDGKVIRRRQGVDLASYPNLKHREVRASEWMGAINSLLRDGYVYGEEVVVDTKEGKDWGELVTLFLEGRKLSKKRRDWYTRSLDIFHQWASKEGITPASLLPSHNSKYATHLSTIKSPLTGKVWEPITRNLHWQQLICFGRWVVEEGYLTPVQLPFFKVKVKEKQPSSTLHKPYTQTQLAAILREVADTPHLNLFFHLAYYTFCRPGRELTNLRVRDIETSTIYIIPSHDKNGVGRRVIIPRALEELLTRYKVRDYPPHYFLFTKKRVPGEVPVDDQYFYTNLRRILRKLGMEGQQYTLYSLKSSGNIALWQATQDLELIRRQNGHSNLSMTMRYLRQLGIIINQEPLLDFPKMGEV